MIRVLIVDDDPLVRSALQLMLGGENEIVVVGEVSDGDEVVRAIAACRPDVVLMDIRMARVDGVTATGLVRNLPEAPEVIVLTTFDTDPHVVGALQAGSSGFLLKDTPPAELIAAIHRVAAGDPVLSPNVTRRLMARVGDQAESADEQRADARRRLDALSGRERDVADAIGRGLSNAEIAAELYMSVATVKSYATRVFAKLGLENRVQVALMVVAAT
jgi:DNA-binding NarL/FixJ family response regulator